MTKRRSDQFLDLTDEDLEAELEDMPVRDSCDAIRRKIRSFIDGGAMKVGEFQKAINVTSTAYSRFMSQNGPHKGADSSVYMSAWAFFKKRELRGEKMPKKAKTAATAAAVDVAGIVLPGEMEDKVEIYDTCGEVRRKINAYLKKGDVTQAQFLRDLAAQFHTSARKFSAQQLNEFRSKKGADAGNTSGTYYGAYVLFEKLRIKENKPKSKHRREMEAIWGDQGGMDTKRDHSRGYWVCAPEQPVQDKYARISFVGGSREGFRALPKAP